MIKTPITEEVLLKMYTKARRSMRFDEFLEDFPVDCFVFNKATTDAFDIHEDNETWDGVVVLPKWRFDRIWDTIRQVNNIWKCSERETAVDRCVDDQWKYISNYRNKLADRPPKIDAS